MIQEFITNTILPLLKDNYDADTVPELMKALDEVSAKIKDSYADTKISTSEAMGIITEVYDVVIASRFILSIEKNEDIREVVIQIIKEIYYGENFLGNPDLKWLPDWIETKIEDYFFSSILPSLVDATLKKLRG